MQSRTLDNSALIVLGMHRSGASAVARVCNLLGVDLDPELMPAAEDNPTGFWEPREIVELHDSLLHAMGSSWDDPAPLPVGWEHSPAAIQTASRVQEVLLESFAGSSLWGIKDPRLCRLFPLWRPLLRQLGVSTKFLLVCREPVDTVASLRRRNGIATPKTALLWLRHVLGAEAASAASPRSVVVYERLLGDWQTTMRRVGADLGLSWKIAPEDADARVRAFLDTKLAHRGQSQDELPDHWVLSDEIRAVHQALIETSEGTGSRQAITLRRASEAAATTLRAADASYGLILRAQHTELTSTGDRAARYEEQITQLREDTKQRTAEYEEQITQLRERASRAESGLEAIKASRSWRVTKPLRATANALRSLARAPRWLAVLTLPAMVAVYRRLPLPPYAKYRLRTLALRILGPFLEGTALHAYWHDTTIAGTAHESNAVLPALRAPVTRFEPLSLPTSEEPAVSVVIPVYNKIEYTWACLRSIVEHAPATPIEIIVVDDCSSDETAQRLADVEGLRYLRNEENSGFVRSCNRGADAARGRYLLFLNNDCEVLPGWLDELVATFERFPDAGLVGSRLLFPDGSLQEAGGIVWKDGSAWNYGRGDDPRKPEYSYLRDIDYVSGASIMVPTELFRRLEGFDLRYAPAYYEDTDLAFRIRDEGLRTLYQPLSSVVHHEGITSGTDVRHGAKAYQVRNHKIFCDRWKRTLDPHRVNGDHPELERDRAATGHVLFVDAVTPMPDHDSGSNDTVQMLRAFRELGYKTTFVPEDNFAFFGRYTEALQRCGTECLYHPYVPSLDQHLAEQGQKYDLVVLSRVRTAARCLAAVKQHCPGAKVVFNTVDLHFLREQREARLINSDRLLAAAEKTRQAELGLVRESDATLVVSSYEARILQEVFPAADIRWLPLMREISGSANERGFGDRQGILFVGGYQHPPNVDAVRYFLDEIWPTVAARLPDVHFYMLGADMPAELKRRGGERVHAVGYVPDLAPWFSRCRISVAPLRYGAGSKGKVISSISHGLPVVATPVASEGMELQNGDHVLVADGPADFVAAIATLYHDESLWTRLSSRGLELARSSYSYEAGKRRIGELVLDLLPEDQAGDSGSSGRAADKAVVNEGVGSS